MSVQDELDTVRDQVAGCHLVAFADLSAQLVLVSSSSRRTTRDVFDGLCSAAKGAFAAADSADAGPELGASDLAITLTETGLTLYLRDVRERGEALCCMCDGTVDPTELIASARAALPKVVAPEDSAP